MPNPKRRHSKARTGKRRAHDALRVPQTGTCPNCQEPRMPQLPDVPAVSEFSPGLNVGTYLGLAAPARTPIIPVLRGRLFGEPPDC